MTILADSPPPRSISLTALPRPPETDTGNLFVRLTPTMAWRLARSMLRGDHGDDEEEEVGEVEFLPLEITFRNRKSRRLDEERHVDLEDGEDEVVDEDGDGGGLTIYASYNGGAPAPLLSGSGSRGPRHRETNDHILDISPLLHPALPSLFRSAPTSAVSVRPLPHVPTAARIAFEPLSTSDWELLEMEASALEDGGLLDQITVVFPGQVFPLQLIRRTAGGEVPTRDLEKCAWIKVAERDLGGSSHDGMDDHHDDDDEDSDDSSSFDSVYSSDGAATTESHPKTPFPRNGCVRLMAETEVIVIPKPRLRRRDESPSSPRDEHRSGIDDEVLFSASSPLRVQPLLLGSNGASVPPPLGFVYLHPSTLVGIPGYCPSTRSSSSSVEPPSTSHQSSRLAGVALVTRVESPYSTQTIEGVEKDYKVAIARVCASEEVSSGHIALHPYLSHQLGVLPLSNWVSVRWLPESLLSRRIYDSRESTIRGNCNVGFVNATSIRVTGGRHVENRPWRVPEGYSYFPPYVHEEMITTSKGTEAKAHPVDLPPMLVTDGSLLPSHFLRQPDATFDRAPDPRHVVALAIEGAPTKSNKHVENKNQYHDRCDPKSMPLFYAHDLRDLIDEGCCLAFHEPHETAEIRRRNGVPSIARPPDLKTVGFSPAMESIALSVRDIITDFSRLAFSSIHTPHKHAIVVTGETGAGKSHLAIASALRLSSSDFYSTVYLDCKKLQASTPITLRTIVEEIQSSFLEATRTQPCVLILDDLDALAPEVDSSGANGDGSIQHQQLNPALVGQVQVIADHILFLSRTLLGGTPRSSDWPISKGIVLLITCRDMGSLSSRLSRSGILHSVFETPSLDAHTRAQFLFQELFPQHEGTVKIPHSVSRLGKITDGFRPHDLKSLASRIRNSFLLRRLHAVNGADIKRNDFMEVVENEAASILRDFVPLSQQAMDISHSDRTVDWSSIGGLYKAKQALHDVIIHPIKFKRIYAKAPITLPSGVLLFGLPGSGKSFIVPSLAKKCHLNLITCHGPELLDRYIGASEAKIRQLFARASAAAPSLIFFDEFDSLAPQRGSDHSGVTDRVVNQLLTLLDGAEKSKNSDQIFIIAATSRPDKIDKALLRPGRLERHIYMGYPESMVEWNDLFRSIMMCRDVDEEIAQISTDDFFREFCQDAEYAKDFSAADMKAVMDTAHLLRVHEILNNDRDACSGRDSEEDNENTLVSEKKDAKKVIIGKRHIIEAVKKTRPSLLPKDWRMLHRCYKPFMSHDVVSFGGRENQSNTDMAMAENMAVRLKTSLR
mmetsp:Transcript_23725/g.47295  ORF Transcript_23725/g.47295 Transcript_23725/m.47295 type:complete len:1290 (-) Transcript_23725:113-3982(-)